MKDKWVINRIGLVDFWYYDDQEFSFVNGRMLLRGTNGSGKSVTMQSMVPLLLDGNIRPERLDPFGSRDRKMANYLLEDGDGRDERTGYLYMEFKRENLEVYHTIGMGMRAKRGKNLDSWYFYISDGRRINRDFLLYKESDGKITLSKKELENKLGNGGRVITSQQEYMEYVNKLIFGFDTVEEYKELIDLLIQLRTPKLSKDFKPTIINEILSNSLQPLSEDDLRPMAEAIENMDTLNTNLSNKKSSLLAAEKINKQYSSYNEFILREKAKQYIKASEENNKLSAEILKAKADLITFEKKKIKAEENKIKLDQERLVRENEKETLNSSDAVSLKQRENDVSLRIKESKQQEISKAKQLDGKKEKWKEKDLLYKKEKEKEEIVRGKIKKDLQEMEDELTTVFTDEHSFFSKEIIENLDKEISYDTHIQDILRVTKHLENGTRLLYLINDQKVQRERVLQKYDEEKKTRSSIERIITQEETDLQSMLQSQKELIYKWNRDNKELILDSEVLQKISIFLEKYDKNSDYLQVKKWVQEKYYHYFNNLNSSKISITEEMKREKEILDSILEELDEWNNQKDPEPEITLAVKKNREKLKEKHIPYYRLYEAVDFEEILYPQKANYLEESLLEMGLLDALIIDKEYKQQVLKLDEGTCDKYIFTDSNYQINNLSKVLKVSDDKNDIFGNATILAVLNSIGIKDESGSYISDNGTYGLGILQGTITGEYKARYIGVNARVRYRNEQIAILEEKVKTQTLVVDELRASENRFKLRIGQLDEENNNLPEGDILREKINIIEEKKMQLEAQTNKILDLEVALREQSDNIRVNLELVNEIAEKIYIESKLKTFEDGLEEIKEYYKSVMSMKNDHTNYLSIISKMTDYADNLAGIDGDIEQILYELSQIKIRCQKDEMELSSITEQLKLTNYEEIKEKLNYCIERLSTIPMEIEECIRIASQSENEIKNNKDFVASSEPRQIYLTSKKEVLKNNLMKELSLGYTDYSEIQSEEGDLETQIIKMHSELILGKSNNENKEELRDKTNKVFYENRGYLLDYNLNFQNQFEEDYSQEFPDIYPQRIEITGRFRGENIKLGKLISYLKEEIEDMDNLIKNGDKELFEDILANTIGRKIRSKINMSISWVNKMNDLMESMNTSSGLKLSLRWRSKTAEDEEQLDTKELVELLKKDARIMNDQEFQKLSMHFRSKVLQARRNTKESTQPISFFAIMRETLDYRKWFEFQLFFQKSGEVKKELSNSMFNTFSGGEKAMSMYVPLFSAVVAKFKGAREDAPRIVSLDEAFAGVDNNNIRDMFRLMSEFEFNFIINSQVLWGDCDTLDGLAIYQLYRLNNQKFVTVMSFIWNGNTRINVEQVSN